MYNPGKVTGCGLLVEMVCEALAGYICDMDICQLVEVKHNRSVMVVMQGPDVAHPSYIQLVEDAKDTMLLILDRNLRQNIH
jgi:hypothetical protein